MSFKSFLFGGFLFGLNAIVGFSQVVDLKKYIKGFVEFSNTTAQRNFLGGEIIITHFLPIDGGVYEPNKKIDFQVEIYERNLVESIVSVHFEIDNNEEEAIYDSQLNRWMVNISMPPVSGDYKVKAVAVNNQGVKKVSEINISVKEKIENVLPKVDFLNIKDGDLIETDEQGLFIVDFSATDADGEVERVMLKVNNGKENIFDLTDNGKYSGSWMPPRLGNYNLTIEATDNLGARSTKSVNIEVVSSQYCYDSWRNYLRYSIGDRVSFNGRNYVAYWDNLNQNPELFSTDYWDSWMKLSLCNLDNFKSTSPNSYNHSVKKSLKDIAIFPNPASDVIYFDQQPTAEMEIEVVSITGKKIIKYVLLPGDNSVNIEQLPNGSYMVNFRLGDEFIQKRFIKFGK